jgi:recombination protein RecA
MDTGKYNYSEIAKRAGVTRGTIYNWLNRGTLDSELLKRGIRLSPMGDVEVDKEIVKQLYPDIKDEYSPGEVMKEPQIKDGKVVFFRQYIRMVNHDGVGYWLAMPASEQEMKWKEKTAEAYIKEVNEKNPTAYIDGVLPSIAKISTGIDELDRILGGGLAEGRMIEVFGENSTGKTTIALQIAAHFQGSGKRVAYMDAEQGIDKEYAKSLGVNFDLLHLDQSSGMEETIENIRDVCREGLADLVIVDSIAAMLPMAEYEGLAGDANMAVKAKLMAQLCRMIPSNMAKNKVTVLFINQIRNFSTGWGASEYTPGGNSMKFAAFQRIKLKLVSESDKKNSRDVKFLCIKNKVFSPYEECTLHLEYGKGFTRKGGLVARKEKKA